MLFYSTPPTLYLALLLLFCGNLILTYLLPSRMQFHFALAATSVLTHATKHPKQNNLESDLFVGISPLLYTTYQKHPSHQYDAPANPPPIPPVSRRLCPCENHYASWDREPPSESINHRNSNKSIAKIYKVLDTVKDRK